MPRLGRAIIVSSGAALVARACAMGPFDRESDGVLRHRTLDYAITEPAFAPADRFERVSLDGTDIAYRSPDGRSMSLSSRCVRIRSSPQMLARRLLAGTGSQYVIESHPIEHGGDPGWRQKVDAGEAPARVRIETVTIVNGGCVFDFLLVGRPDSRFDEVSAVFERWWLSFRRPARREVDT